MVFRQDVINYISKTKRAAILRLAKLRNQENQRLQKEKKHLDKVLKLRKASLDNQIADVKADILNTHRTRKDDSHVYVGVLPNVKAPTVKPLPIDTEYARRVKRRRLELLRDHEARCMKGIAASMDDRMKRIIDGLYPSHGDRRPSPILPRPPPPSPEESLERKFSQMSTSDRQPLVLPPVSAGFRNMQAIARMKARKSKSLAKAQGCASGYGNRNGVRMPQVDCMSAQKKKPRFRGGFSDPTKGSSHLYQSGSSLPPCPGQSSKLLPLRKRDEGRWADKPPSFEELYKECAKSRYLRRPGSPVDPPFVVDLELNPPIPE